MATFLSGFKDSDAWAYRADGVIVAKARDRSYKEVARHGVPIDILVAASADYGTEILPSLPPSPPATPVATPRQERRSSLYCNCDACEMCEYLKDCLVYVDDYALPLDLSDDFEMYLKPVVPRGIARARRLAAKKPVKESKYGSKASKAHTVAARILATPADTDGCIKAPVKRCEACKRPQCESAYESWEALHIAKCCERCDATWVEQLATIQEKIEMALTAAAVEREELRLEQQARDARYRE